MLHNIFFGWQKNNSFSVIFFFFGIVLISSSSCKKKDNLLGKDILDPSELLSSGGIDTFSLITYTVEDNEVFTENPRYGLLGILNDREFGVVDLGFYTQVRLSGLTPNFGDVSQITIDSFVLALEYVGGYGYMGNQTFEVFELDEVMNIDSSYQASQDLAIKSENWVHGSGVLQVNPSGITVVDGDTVTTQLRIPLNPAKAMQIIQDAANFPAEYADNGLFSTNYLKGLNVKTNGVAPPQGQGMVGYFDLLDQDSKLIIYYKENGQVKPAYDLVMNYECADYNRFKINNFGKRITSVVANPSLGQTEFYAQSGKYRAVVGFPSLKKLPKDIIIHSAKLYLPIQYLQGSRFTPAIKIYTLVTGSTSYRYEAVYDASVKGYVIDVRDYVQNFNVGTVTSESLTIYTENPVLSVEYPTRVIYTDRIIFNGPQSDKKNKPKLILSYTEF
jgi:hypothetical protein